MRKSNWRVCALMGVLCALVVLAGCGGSSRKPKFDSPAAAPGSGISAISFEDSTIPDGGEGQLYNVILGFITEGNASLPDRFEIGTGALPDGIQLLAEVDGNGDQTGSAQLVGFPREQGGFAPGSPRFAFSIRAISTATDPALADEQLFTVGIDSGQIAILTPTAAEGTTDVAVPAFPDVINFVNPANAKAFFSFKFEIAGGSTDRDLNIYLPREVELSVFDTGVTDLTDDTDESAVSGSKYEVNFSDGGWFVESGSSATQVGGFQSPRGVVGDISPLDTDWFQDDPGLGPNLDSRRDIDDDLGLAGGDFLVIPGRVIQFSNYFDARFIRTKAGASPSAPRRKYPFTLNQYDNVFFLPSNAVTPLRYNIIVEAIDRNGTGFKNDDRIDRRSYIVQVKIPDIRIDTLFLPDGQAGVDYNEFVAASGGVPPLLYQLEWVDSGDDFMVTEGTPLDENTFGMGMELDSGLLIGVPRAAAEGADLVELTVRVSATVMNSTQSGGDPASPSFGPTPNEGEFVGAHDSPSLVGLPVDERNGLHRTYKVQFVQPTDPVILNSNLNPGVDGTGYAGDQLVGGGGVPGLVPDPRLFTGSGIYDPNPKRNYTWSATYTQDASWDDPVTPGGTANPAEPGLPNFLTLDGDIASFNNGAISGTTTDRGFHAVTFTQTDDFAGEVLVGDPPIVGPPKFSTTLMVLSVSPDSGVYVRGVQSTEAPAGKATSADGLEDGKNQMAEARNVPIALAGALYTVETGKTPTLYEGTDIVDWDILPVMLANGGDDEHVNKSGPSISGFWPSESNRETTFNYNSFAPAWSHSQQEMTWIQTNLPSHNRVFLYGQTRVIKYNNAATNGPDSHRYQEYQNNGKRGVIVANPSTGDFYVAAVLSNGDSAHGSQFGSEVVLGHGTEQAPSTDGGTYAQVTGSGSTDTETRSARDCFLQGLGTYIESHTRTASSPVWAWTPRTTMGRTATSVAVSADGVWSATAMRGGDEPKILLWRNDGQPIDATLLGSTDADLDPMTGFDRNGDALADPVAAIVNLGGADANGVIVSTDQQNLLPDSLMFVNGGLLFLMNGAMNRVFGMSLVDGDVTQARINTSTLEGQFIPDQDNLRLAIAQAGYGNQFAYAFNEAEPGSEGPDQIAVIGNDLNLYREWSLSLSPGGTSRGVHAGYVNKANATRQLYYLDLGTGGDLDLDLVIVENLSSGSNAGDQGDLMPPGRLGEENDYMAMSPDGAYIAVVRDWSTTNNFSGLQNTFATSSSSTSFGQVNHDLLIFSTDRTDLDTAGHNILFLGTGTQSNATSGVGAVADGDNLTARAHLNAIHRRIDGVTFGSNTGAGERTVIFNYHGVNTSGRYPAINGRSGPGWALNPDSSYGVNFTPMGLAMNVNVQFKDEDGDEITFTNPGSFMTNGLEDIGDDPDATGITGIGPTSPPFGRTDFAQAFWSTFKSHNGNYIYYVSDQVNGRNYMFGYNISGADIAGEHDMYVPFTPHASNIGFEQINVNSFNYESRFFAVPANDPAQVTLGALDGAGFVFFIASAASAGSGSSTDLEVYCFDADHGGDAVVLSAAVTDTNQNALNHLYVSMDGNVVAAQRANYTANSQTSRAVLNSNTDLFVCINVHAALAGATPDTFMVSENMSHGSSVGFVGDGSLAGPQAIVFSRADPAATTDTGNRTWDDRELKIALLAQGSVVQTLDATRSHYVVIAGSRKTDDDPTDLN